MSHVAIVQTLFACVIALQFIGYCRTPSESESERSAGVIVVQTISLLLVFTLGAWLAACPG